MKHERNGVYLKFNDVGYVSVPTFLNAASWHCPYREVLPAEQAMKRLKCCTSKNPLSMTQNKELYVDPQVIIAMIWGLEKSFTETVMALMLQNHKARGPSEVPPQPCVDEIRLKLEQERTKQLQTRADATKQGLNTLSHISVNTNPDVVDLVRDIFQGFSDLGNMNVSYS